MSCIKLVGTDIASRQHSAWEAEKRMRVDKMTEQLDLRGETPESWHCIDCGVNTAPGMLSRVELEREFAAGALRLKEGVSFSLDNMTEVYTVRAKVWKAAGMEPFGGCLCIGCIEKRLGR